MPKILVADDEPHIRMLMEETFEDLETEGVTVLFAENGAKALDMVRAERPELVFLDIMMPQMNGYEVCKAIRQDPELSSVRIVMLTAKGQAFDREKGLELGAQEYLTKPFNPLGVVRLARQLLGLA